MRILLKAPYGDAKAGETPDLPDHVAANLVAAGFAEPAAPEPAPVRGKRAVGGDAGEA